MMIMDFMQYRRAFIKGGSYFFTVVTEQREPVFANESAVILLREAFRKVMEKRPFVINAVIVLPDHLHSIWTLPPDDTDYSTRWRLIKTFFSKRYDDKKTVIKKNRINKNQKAIWQQRYWEHCLRDEKDFSRHVDYIHYNPVKHGYITLASSWPYSSIHRYIEQGLVDQRWGGGGMSFDDSIGRE